MALLLAMYQKFRLIREKNELVLKQASYSSKLSRIEKNIERTQKRYTSLFAQLDQQANTFKNNARLQFQNMFGLGSNSVNPYNYSGMNAYLANGIQAVLKNGGCGVFIGNKDGDKPKADFLEEADLNGLLEYYSNMGSLQPIKIGDETYNLYLNYLSQNQIYIASNIIVEANEQVVVGDISWS